MDHILIELKKAKSEFGDALSISNLCSLIIADRLIKLNITVEHSGKNILNKVWDTGKKLDKLNSNLEAIRAALGDLSSIEDSLAKMEEKQSMLIGVNISDGLEYITSELSNISKRL
jgi:heterodisulfide reductase subunit C